MRAQRLWWAKVTLDTAQVLNITAPLVVVVEALSRTLASIDPLLVQSSLLEIELRPW